MDNALAVAFGVRSVVGGVRLFSLIHHRVEALINGILVRPRERGKHQVTAVRVALGHSQLVAIFDGASDFIDVGEIDLRINALCQHVQPQRDQAHVARALTVAKQAALDAVRSCHEPQFSSGDARSAVIVRVQRDDDGITTVQVAVHPFDRVRVHVGRRHLHRRGQINDDGVLRGGIHDLDDGIADFLGIGHLSAGVGLGGILPAPVGPRIISGDGFN